MNFKLSYLTACLAICLTGCTTVVQFESDIPGAEVHSVSGVSHGRTPASVTYSNDALDATRGADGCARIDGVTYTWLSGAQAHTPESIRLCGKSDSFHVRLNRPADAPGIETDYKAALERERELRAQLEQELEMERLRADEAFMFGGPFMMGPMLGPSRHHGGHRGGGHRGPRH